MSKNRKLTWFALVALAPGLVLLWVMGLWAFMSATPPLHTDPQNIPSVTHAAPAPKWADAVEQARGIVRAGLTEYSLPGLSVAVGVGGDIVWAEGVGFADLEDRIPVSPETRFRLGTASVALTSAAAGLLLEQGTLKLDEKIQTYVPAFPEKPWPVTVRQLMAHLAGVRTDGGDEGPLLAMQCKTPADALPQFAQSALLFEPGTQFRFSSYGWILMSAAVEAASGEPLFRFMRTQIFDPLGMNDTKADSATDPVPNRATFYFPRFAADPRYGLHLTRPLDYSCYAGASALLSTPSDLVRFGLAIDKGRLLQPATVALLQTSQQLPSGEQTGYGLGWDLETVALGGQDTRVVGHDGESLGGMVASLLTVPEHGVVVAVMSNIAYADTFALASKIAAAFAGPATSAPRK